MVRTQPKKKTNPSDPFKKRKQKVGKKKLEPVAATKAEIHSAKIFLKKQHPDEEEEEQYRNERRLSFQDLLTRLKHYASASRKDALLQLVQMVNVTTRKAAEAVPRSMHGTLFNHTLPLLCDADVEVRKAAVALLRAALELLSAPREERERGASELPPLFALAPVVVRHCSVALTHMNPDARRSGCQGLAELTDRLRGHPIPEVMVLLRGTELLFSSSPRPPGTSSPAVMRVFVELLNNALVFPPPAVTVERDHKSLIGKAGKKEEELPQLSRKTRKGRAQKIVPAEEARAAAEAAQVPLDLGTWQGVVRYMREGILDLLSAKWLEATQERGEKTAVGEWELGLVQILNLLLLAVSARHPNTSADILLKCDSVRTPLSALAGRLAQHFPYQGPGAVVQRLNAQISLVLSFFFPSHQLRVTRWAEGLLSKGGAARGLRGEDVLALCVCFERLAAAGPAPADDKGGSDAEEEEEMEEDEEEAAGGLAGLLTATSGVPGQLEVVRSLRRLADGCLARVQPAPPALQEALRCLPQVLFECVNRQGAAQTPAPLSVRSSGSLQLLPTVAGAELRTVVAEGDPKEEIARECVRLLTRAGTLSSVLDEPDFRTDLLACVFGVGEMKGVLQDLPADAAAEVVAILPRLSGGAELAASARATLWTGEPRNAGEAWLASLAVGILHEAGVFRNPAARAELKQAAAAADPTGPLAIAAASVLK
eukprot:Hpha_TRINITY_DN30727_c0_g1::TRINITY_DN30727_c0_g1_i1::g.28310::m.28310